MTHRHPLQHRDLIPDHVLAPSHKALVDHLRSIVAPCVDMYTLFHHRVRAGTQSLARLIPTRSDLRRLLSHRGRTRDAVWVWEDLLGGCISTIRRGKGWSKQPVAACEGSAQTMPCGVSGERLGQGSSEDKSGQAQNMCYFRLPSTTYSVVVHIGSTNDCSSTILDSSGVNARRQAKNTRLGLGHMHRVNSTLLEANAPYGRTKMHSARERKMLLQIGS